MMQSEGPLLSIGRTRSDERARAARAARWAHIRPRNAHVYVENRCHLRCAHCYESEETHPSGQSMSVEQYARLFDELAQLGVLYLTLSGGEIFLRRDILDIVERARKKRFAVTLFTSGTHIDESKADRIAALRVHAVEVSLYSAKPEVHDDFTGIPGSHRRTVRAVALLAERGVPVTVKCALMKRNVDELDDIIALCGSLGADWTFGPTMLSRVNGDKAPLDLALDPDETRRKVLSRPDLAPHFRKRSAEEFCSGNQSAIPSDGAMCGAARGVITVGADGGVYACGIFPVAAGNWKPGSLEEIWFGSAQLDDIRRSTLETMNECGECGLKSTCQPCMAQALTESGDIRGCNSSSRRAAEAVRLLAENKARANRKMEHGRPLPVLDATYTPPIPKGKALGGEP